MRLAVKPLLSSFELLLIQLRFILEIFDFECFSAEELSLPVVLEVLLIEAPVFFMKVALFTRIVLTKLLGPLIATLFVSLSPVPLPLKCVEV